MLCKVNRIRMRGVLARSLDSFSWVLDTADKASNLLFGGNPEQYPSLTFGIVQSVLGQRNVPKVMADKLKSQCLKRVVHILQVSSVHPRPVHELHPTTAAA